MLWFENNIYSNSLLSFTRVNFKVLSLFRTTIGSSVEYKNSLSLFEEINSVN